MWIMRKAAVAALALSMAVTAMSGGQALGPAAAADPAAYGKACNTYANRARFKPRVEEIEFVVLLAEGCRAAMTTLYRGDPGERAAAERFLDRLVEFRDTIVTINMDRLFGVSAGRYAKPLSSDGTLLTLGGVTETGEYLIAHRMGLLAALDDWRAKVPDFTLALTPQNKG